MGSSYSCIVTREKIDVPVEMPRFLKRDVLTIPIDAGDNDVAEFLELFSNGEIMVPDDAKGTGDDDIGNVLSNAGQILRVLNRLTLTDKAFMLMYSSDFADIPTEEYYAVFKDGRMVKETCYSSDGENYTGDYNAAINYLHITYEDIVFFSYYDNAAVEYVESIFIPGPWRV